MDRSRTALTGLVAIPLAFLAVFYIYPVASILLTSVYQDGIWDFGGFRAIVTRDSFGRIAWFTLWQATISTVLTVLVALPGAYVLSRYEFRGKRVVRALVTVPFVLPTVVVGTAFLALLGPNGRLGFDLSRTVWIILIAHVFYNYAVVIRTVGGLWSHLDHTTEEAAAVLGAGRWRTFVHVTLPLLRPAIAAASAIVFLFSFTSFGVILILGNLRQVTLEVEIWRQTVNLLDFSTAAALAVMQLVGITFVLAAYSRYQERRSQQQRLRPAAEARRPVTAGQKLFLAANLAVMGLFLGGPLLTLAVRSFGGWDWQSYRGLWSGRDQALVDPIEALTNSLWIAAVATVIAVVVGLIAAAVIAYRPGGFTRYFDVLLMLPLGTSAVTIGFGLLVALDWPVDLRSSVWLIPIGHALVAVPFVVRTAVPVMRSVQARLREAAAVLGASPTRVWREVDLPITARAFAAAAGFAYTISLGEFGATIFIARPDTPTLPIAIFRMLGRPGADNFGQAMALATILMAVTAGAVLAIERFRVGNVGEF